MLPLTNAYSTTAFITYTSHEVLMSFQQLQLTWTPKYFPSSLHIREI